MRFTLRQLEYFIAAGEAGSITLASERIHISQPSISTAISHLEQELNVQLFIRHHAQGLSLTPAGRDLLREAKALVSQAQNLYLKASEATDQVRGSLSLGCMVTLAPMLVPELTHSFTSAFPATSIRHMEGNHEELFDGLRRSEIDIAICYDLQIPEDVSFTPLAQLPPHVLMGEADPLARQPSIALADIAKKPMILLDLPISREYFLALFLNEGLEPTIAARSTHQEVVRTMVANGYGYSILNVTPRSDLALDGRKLVRVRLSGNHRPMTIGTAVLKSLRQSKLVSAFDTHCQSYVSNSYIPGMVAPSFAARRV
ncbi:LysR family transcriptional regulator [Lutibaculum baratangense]|nr:LysR family transcriptional regulator [Lutibaculum baratangense]